jgi:hypothetical protein
VEQGPLYDAQMAQARPRGPGLPTPWDVGNNAFLNTAWKVDIETFMCPSDPPLVNRNESPSVLNYKACVGDDYHQNHFRPDQGRDNRGIFQPLRYLPLAAITDGTSNTIMLGEVAGGGGPRDIKGGVAVNVQAWNPAGCLARKDPANPKRLIGDVRADFRPHSGRAWDGRPYFVGFATLVPPNGPSCHWGGVDGNEHMGTLSSFHPGGGQVTLADASVRFIPETINAINMALDDPGADGGTNPGNNYTGPSIYGVWGALGSRAGGESAVLP